MLRLFMPWSSLIVINISLFGAIPEHSAGPISNCILSKIFGDSLQIQLCDVSTLIWHEMFRQPFFII
jgi:hypothetical protein